MVHILSRSQNFSSDIYFEFQCALQNTLEQKIFFARKFEAVVNNGVVNWLDERLNSPYPAGMCYLPSHQNNSYYSFPQKKTVVKVIGHD